jgi:hypothetical protein
MSSSSDQISFTTNEKPTRARITVAGNLVDYSTKRSNNFKQIRAIVESDVVRTTRVVGVDIVEYYISQE